jgi:hypothetical protein
MISHRKAEKKEREKERCQRAKETNLALFPCPFKRELII